jgi:integrase
LQHKDLRPTSLAVNLLPVCKNRNTAAEGMAMGRKLTGWFDAARGVWYARLGPISEMTGKPRPGVLKDEAGVPIARDDATGKAAAIRRLLGERDRPPGPTVAEVIRAYLAWHKSQGSAPATQRTHWFHLKRFGDFVHEGVRYADRPAASIVTKDLGRIKASGKGAIRHTYMSVLACWRWAARPIEDREPERLIPSNPLEGLIRPRGGQRPSRVVEWPLARRILRLARAWARERHRPYERTRATRWVKVCALFAIAYSGGRTAEIVTMEWGDIRWDAAVAAIPVDRHKTGRATGKMRYVPLLPRLIALLRAIERWPHRHETYVFATRWSPGRPSLRTWWDSIRDDIKPYLAARGVALPPGFRPYWLRHTVATQAAQAMGKEKAAKAMGHSPQVLDQVYDHVEADRVREVGEAVDRLRRGKGRSSRPPGTPSAPGPGGPSSSPPSPSPPPP